MGLSYLANHEGNALQLLKGQTKPKVVVNVDILTGNQAPGDQLVPFPGQSQVVTGGD